MLIDSMIQSLDLNISISHEFNNALNTDNESTNFERMKD